MVETARLILALARKYRQLGEFFATRRQNDMKSLSVSCAASVYICQSSAALVASAWNWLEVAQRLWQKQSHGSLQLYCWLLLPSVRKLRLRSPLFTAMFHVAMHAKLNRKNRKFRGNSTRNSACSGLSSWFLLTSNVRNTINNYHLDPNTTFQP